MLLKANWIFPPFRSEINVDIEGDNRDNPLSPVSLPQILIDWTRGPRTRNYTPTPSSILSLEGWFVDMLALMDSTQSEGHLLTLFTLVSYHCMTIATHIIWIFPTNIRVIDTHLNINYSSIHPSHFHLYLFYYRNITERRGLYTQLDDGFHFIDSPWADLARVWCPARWRPSNEVVNNPSASIHQIQDRLGYPLCTSPFSWSTQFPPLWAIWGDHRVGYRRHPMGINGIPP